MGPSKVPVSLDLIILLLLGMIALAASSGGANSTCLIHIIAFLFLLFSALPYSNTAIFGALRSTMDFELVLLIGIVIEGFFIALLRTASAERTYKELLNRGADKSSAGEVLWGQISLSLKLVSLSLVAPLLVTCIYFLARSDMAGILSDLPFPTFLVPLAFGIFAVVSILYYLSRER